LGTGRRVLSDQLQFHAEIGHHMELEFQNILIIDDDQVDVLILTRCMESVNMFRAEWTHVRTENEALEVLSSHHIDLVFLDYYLGNETGTELLKSIRKSGFLGPVIILTNNRDEYIAKDMIRAGADDYVVKQDMNPDLLYRSITIATSQFARRKAEFEHELMFVELQAAKSLLEVKNKNLQSLYQMAHQFVDNVSHEFRTPLTVIKEFASIIHDGLAGQVTNEQSEYLEIIDNRVDDLSIMVDDMLDISKLEAGLLSVARVNLTVDAVLEQIESTLAQKARSAKIDLEFQIPDDLPEVFGDLEKIGRILINLVVNAVKFSDEGGQVTVSAKDDPAQHCIRFSVTDNGPGISEDRQKLLFERFKQFGGGLHGNVKGFGLGLNIAKELVHLNLGEISVESTAGRGSTFSFTIPYSERRSLIRRYVRKLTEYHHGPVHLALAEIRFDGVLAKDSASGVERLIHQNSRSNDLCLRIDDQLWVVVGNMDAEQSESFRDRVNQSLSEFRRDPVESKISDWTMRILGNWPTTSESSPSVDALLDMVALEEETHA
jgi:signal transduction histidine kinase